MAGVVADVRGEMDGLEVSAQRKLLPTSWPGQQMLVSDTCFDERRAKRITLVLRIGPRPWNGAHVDDDFDHRAAQQRNELVDRPR